LLLPQGPAIWFPFETFVAFEERAEIATSVRQSDAIEGSCMNLRKSGVTGLATPPRLLANGIQARVSRGAELGAVSVCRYAQDDKWKALDGNVAMALLSALSPQPSALSPQAIGIAAYLGLQSRQISG
jgi:hypothetical protein